MPKIYIDGTPTGWQDGSLSMDTAVDERSVARFTVPDTGSTPTIMKGTPIVITDTLPPEQAPLYDPAEDVGLGPHLYDYRYDEVVVFAGVVENVKRKAIVAPDGGGIYIDVDVVDNHWYADKRLIVEGYEETSTGDIVRDIVRQRLREENIYTHPYPATTISIARGEIMGYWRLASGPDDESWHDRDGTDVNGTSDPEAVPLVYRPAADGFTSPVNDDHLGGYVEMAGSSLIRTTFKASDFLKEIEDTNAFTVSYWFRRPTDAARDFSMGCGNDLFTSDSGDNLLQVEHEPSGNGVDERIWFRKWSTTSEVAALASDVTLGEWHHFVGVVKNNGRDIDIYIDGTAAGSVGGNDSHEGFTVPTGDPFVVIGAGVDGFANAFEGDLAEVAFYPFELNTEQIGRLHRADQKMVRLEPLDSDPYAYWPCDDPILSFDDPAPTYEIRDVIGDLHGQGFAGGTSADFPFLQADGVTIVPEVGLDLAYYDTTEIRVEFPAEANVIRSDEDWSIEFWLLQYSGSLRQPSADPGIISEGTDANNWCTFAYTADGADPITTFRFEGAANGVSFSTPFGIDISRNEGHHVALVHDAVAGTLTPYIDGVKGSVDGNPFGGEDFALSTHSMFGVVTQGSSVSRKSTSILQNVAKYKRVLTDAEIARRYPMGQAYYSTGNPSRPKQRVADGPLLTEFSLDYVDSANAIGELAELSGYDFLIDANRTLHFHGRDVDDDGCCRAPFTLTQDKMLTGNVSLSEAAPKYRNFQTVKGGTDETTALEEVQQADGEQRTFSTGFPISREPTIEVSTDGGSTWSPQTVGIKGVEENKQFYWNKGDALVTQDSDEPKVSAGSLVRTTYIGQFPLVSVAGDDDERIQTLKTEKVGTGRVDGIIEDSTITSREQGFEVASAKLERYAQRGRTVEFTTRHPGIRAGQIATIELPRLGLPSLKVLVDTVTFEEFAGIEMRYRVTAVSGPALTSWQKFFSRQVDKDISQESRINLSEVEVVTLRETFSGSWTLTEEGVNDMVTVRSCVLLTDTTTLPFTLC